VIPCDVTLHPSQFQMHVQVYGWSQQFDQRCKSLENPARRVVG